MTNVATCFHFRSSSQFGIHSKRDRGFLRTSEVRRCIRHVLAPRQKNDRCKYTMHQLYNKIIAASLSESFLTSVSREFPSVNSLKATDHDRVVHYRCATFHHRSAQVVEVEAAGEQVARYKAHRTEVFTEVFLLAIQNPVDGPRLVAKLFVSVIYPCILTVTLNMRYGSL